MSLRIPHSQDSFSLKVHLSPEATAFLEGKVMMTERQLRQKDLVPVFKTESIVSAVLSGQRNLTVSHIQKLGEFFHLSPAAFFTREVR